jgi:hypothetical protein
MDVLVDDVVSIRRLVGPKQLREVREVDLREEVGEPRLVVRQPVLNTSSTGISAWIGGGW